MVAPFRLKAQTLNSVNKNDILINELIVFNFNPSELNEVLGSPSSITSDYWELTEEVVEVYNYSNAQFQFIENELKSFKLCSSDYSLTARSSIITIGNLINDLQPDFPNSFKNKSNGYMAININSGDFEYILIEYDLSNGSIKSIEHRFY